MTAAQCLAEHWQDGIAKNGSFSSCKSPNPRPKGLGCLKWQRESIFHVEILSEADPIRQSPRRWVWAWVYEEWCRCSGLLRTLKADPWSWGWARWWAAGTWRTCRRPSWSSRCVSSGRRWLWWRIETRRPGSEWGALDRPGAPLLRTEQKCLSLRWSH